ncbi:MAG: 30S ribosomal protein S2 [Patescibacteria group bacterium]
MDKQLSLMSLFEVGAHRGNKKSKLNPKLKDRVFGFNQNLCLINLVETNNSIKSCSEFMYKLGQKRKQILLVGTSKHISNLTPTLANSFQNGLMPYVDNRWLGGTLSNWSTIKKTLKTLEKLENIENNKEFFDKLARNEQLNIVRKREKISKLFKGLVNLKNNKPGAIFIMDANSNDIAIKESDGINIPVIALSNTNTLSLPENLKYTIVTNTNSINAVQLVSETLINSYNQGLVASTTQVTQQQDKEKVKV